MWSPDSIAGPETLTKYCQLHNTTKHNMRLRRWINEHQGKTAYKSSPRTNRELVFYWKLHKTAMPVTDEWRKPAQSRQRDTWCCMTHTAAAAASAPQPHPHHLLMQWTHGMSSEHKLHSDPTATASTVTTTKCRPWIDNSNFRNL